MELNKDNILKGNIEIKENKDFKMEYNLSLKNYDGSKKTAEGICLKNNLEMEFCIYPNYWYKYTGASSQSIDDDRSVAEDIKEDLEVRLSYDMLYSYFDDTKATVGPNENNTCTAYYNGNIECSILNNDKTTKQKYTLSENGEIIA